MTASTFPTSTSSLILPHASQNLSGTLTSLKRSTLSISNRLQSIHHDSLFVQSVSAAYGLPLIANERCGSWYIPPEKKAGSAYFKSTDGHWGQWGFSMRRLNLHILGIVGEAGGCIIVDSTRRGKRMPDALSKTIPIWCTVINRLLFQERLDAHVLRTPPEAVGPSEHAQIESRINGLVEETKALDLDISSLRSILKKPLRASWVTPDYLPSDNVGISSDHHTIICCTASHRVEGTEMSENGYIQGAGDDSEGWSRGVTPALLWTHKEQLLRATEEDIEGFLSQLISVDAKSPARNFDIVKIGSTNLYIGSVTKILPTNMYDGIITCSNDPPALPVSTEEELRLPKCLHLRCSDGKLGSRALRSHLPRVPAFITSLRGDSGPPKILFASSSRQKDLSVGVALVVLCLFFDEDYKFCSKPCMNVIDKALIRRRLAYITVADPTANPSRSTLQSVNWFLMSGNG